MRATRGSASALLHKATTAWPPRRSMNALLLLDRSLAQPSGSSSSKLEMGTVIDRYKRPEGWVRSWRDFTSSTLAVAGLRRTIGWTVPAFKQTAAEIYGAVGAAFAAGDLGALKRLTTPSCHAVMRDALKSRADGERHEWETLDVRTSIKQVRIGNHKSTPGRQFAQVTCSIDATLIWSVFDRHGKRVGGMGSSEEPHALNDLWVFERCISEPAEKSPTWRLKEKLPTE